MATRFYLIPQDEAVPISPAFSAVWEDTSIAKRAKCLTVKRGFISRGVSFKDANAVDKDILYFQYVSDVLTTGQTIMAEQSVIMQAIPLEETISGNLYLTLMMYVVNSVGNFASKILDITRDNIEADDQSVFPTHNRSLAVNMNSLFLDYITQEGDRIVIEIGLSGDPIGSGTHTGKIYLGDDNASDLPIDDTSFSGNPWVEIPDNLTFISSINTSVKIL